MFKFSNLEQASLTNSLSVPGYAPASGMQGAWGVFVVATIEHGVVVVPNSQIASNGSRFFVDDGPGGMAGQITGIFYGLQTTSPATWTGGTIDFFWHDKDATYIDGSCVSGSTCAPDAAAVGFFTSGTLLVRLKLAGGIDPADAQVFTKSNVPIGSLLTSGGFGQFASFADVDASTTGAWSAALDHDWFMTNAGAHDMRLLSVVTSQSTWSGKPAGAIGLRSNDPIVVFTR